MHSRRSKVGSALDLSEQRYVVAKMKPDDQPPQIWLRNTRFYITARQALDRRCTRPAGKVLTRTARSELAKLRATIRAVAAQLHTFK